MHIIGVVPVDRQRLQCNQSYQGPVIEWARLSVSPWAANLFFFNCSIINKMEKNSNDRTEYQTNSEFSTLYIRNQVVGVTTAYGGITNCHLILQTICSHYNYVFFRPKMYWNRFWTSLESLRCFPQTLQLAGEGDVSHFPNERHRQCDGHRATGVAHLCNQ